MSAAEQQEGRIGHLLRLLCDEKLDDEEAKELAGLLATSDSARRRYVESVQLCIDLADWSQATGPVSILYPAVGNGINGEAKLRKALEPVRDKEAARRKARVSHQESSPAQRRISFRPWLVWSAAAATFFIVSMCGWSYFGHKTSLAPTDADTIAGVSASGNGEHVERQKDSRPEKFVAHVVEVTSDAKWDEKLHPREFLMRL